MLLDVLRQRCRCLAAVCAAGTVLRPRPPINFPVRTATILVGNSPPHNVTHWIQADSRQDKEFLTYPVPHSVRPAASGTHGRHFGGMSSQDHEGLVVGLSAAAAPALGVPMGAAVFLLGHPSWLGERASAWHTPPRPFDCHHSADHAAPPTSAPRLHTLAGLVGGPGEGAALLSPSGASG